MLLFQNVKLGGRVFLKELKKKNCMEILVASLLASVISKREKLKFPFPPLVTKRSESNPPQQSAELSSDKK